MRRVFRGRHSTYRHCGASTRATGADQNKLSSRGSRALRLWEPVVAERLARATLESGPDIEAACILGAALSDQDRSEEALAAASYRRDASLARIACERQSPP